MCDSTANVINKKKNRLVSKYCKRRLFEQTHFEIAILIMKNLARMIRFSGI